MPTPLLLCRLCLLVTGIAAQWLWRDTYALDDAYITYQYADRFAAGDGPTFRDGEPAFGVSTPGYFLLISALRFVGVPCTTAGDALCAGAQIAGPLLALELLRPWMPLTLSALGAFLLAVNPSWIWCGHTGMESTLFVCMLLCTLLACRSSKPFVGLLFGCCVLLRLDGIVLGAPLLLLLPPRRWLREAIVFIFVVGTWAIFAWWHFGSPLPDSIGAKQQAHSGEFLALLQEYFSGVFLLPRAHVALLALAGLAVMRGLLHWHSPKNREILAIFGFLVLNLAGYVKSGITPFPWYFTPMVACLVLLASHGLSVTLRFMPHFGGLVILAFLIHSTWQAMQDSEKTSRWRYQPYVDMAQWLDQNVAPGESLLVWEAGYLSYLLPRHAILDCVGINTREIQSIRREVLESEPSASKLAQEEEVVRRVLLRFQPTCIASAFAQPFGFREMMRAEWFRGQYHLVREGPWVTSQDVARPSILFLRNDTPAR